ncbi:MAG TPA: pyrroline-5-carboxylate reductase, partial [Peptococcaceae bacterium]|nr:pyrroline-5-carboxylate reductase [Peptococcaceae bacterium]
EKTYGIKTTKDNRELVKHCETIVLSVKPQYFKQVVPDMQGLITEKSRILSIMAGITTQRIEDALGVKAHIVRIMPNTPALVGSGMAAVCAGTYAEAADLELAHRIFEAVGSAIQVEEHLIDAVSGVSGSGPAYVYVMIQALADGGVRMGLDRKTALLLAAETVKGSAQMVIESGEHPEALKDKVCSPGGTTIEAMYRLEKAGFRAALMEAVQVAAEKAAKL